MSVPESEPHDGMLVAILKREVSKLVVGEIENQLTVVPTPSVQFL